MWWTSLIIASLSGVPNAMAQTNELNLALPQKKQKSKIVLNSELALQTVDRKLDRNDQSTPAGLQNFVLSMGYNFDENLTIITEILGEQAGRDVLVYFGELKAQYKIPVYRAAQLDVGFMYYTYGVLTTYEGIYARRPDYYADLLVSRRGIDLGGKLRWQPLENLPIYAEASIFTGEQLRVGDDRVLQAEQRPIVATFGSDFDWGSMRLSWIQRQYADEPRMEAIGLEYRSKTWSFLKSWVKIRPLAEYWSLNYQRQDGQERSGQAYLLGYRMDLWRVYHRWQYSQENWTGSNSSQITADFGLLAVGLKLSDAFSIEYQNIVSNELQPDLSRTQINEDVFRTFISFSEDFLGGGKL